MQHSCDQKWCVNPDHLSLGTNATNYDDRRYKNPAGNKLMPEQVAQIRARFTDGHSKRAIAREFAISPRMVGFIVDRINWNRRR